MCITLLTIRKTYLVIISVTVQLRCKLTEGKLTLSMADSSWYTLCTYYYFEVNLYMQGQILCINVYYFSFYVLINIILIL
jgi:hypothetical protein